MQAVWLGILLVGAAERKLRKPKKVLDETKETPHNLISLLLTNKTICQVRRQQAAGSGKNR